MTHGVNQKVQAITGIEKVRGLTSIKLAAAIAVAAVVLAAIAFGYTVVLSRAQFCSCVLAAIPTAMQETGTIASAQWRDSGETPGGQYVPGPQVTEIDLPSNWTMPVDATNFATIATDSTRPTKVEKGGTRLAHTLYSFRQPLTGGKNNP